jgi:hypothetical protein
LLAPKAGKPDVMVLERRKQRLRTVGYYVCTLSIPGARLQRI